MLPQCPMGAAALLFCSLFSPSRSSPAHPLPHLVLRAGALPCPAPSPRNRDGQHHWVQLQAPAAPSTVRALQVVLNQIYSGIWSPLKGILQKKKKMFSRHPGAGGLHPSLALECRAAAAQHMVELASCSLLSLTSLKVLFAIAGLESSLEFSFPS